ncbi:MAG: FixH family protein [Bacteroidetes bacterium]|nr:FixH family protein [Bacteroidota bacterium]
MNWGYKILILYASFVIMIIFMVFKASNTKFDLVSDKYYQDELNYQQLIDASSNSNAFSIKNNEALITLPEAIRNNFDSSVVVLYCPQDASFDKKYLYKKESGYEYTIKNEKLHLDRYQIKLFVYSKGKIILYQEQ